MKWSGIVDPSWANRAANGMWYQVVSPPNMPKSRFCWAGKVHSATTQEATPIATSSAAIWTFGALTALDSAGAIHQPRAAAPRPKAMQTRIVQPLVRMLSEPSS